MSRIPAAALCLLAAAVAGCGGGEQEREAPAPPEPGARPTPSAHATAIDVSELEFALRPARLELKPGTYRFRVRNDGQVVHALEIEGPSGEVETPEIDPGKSATLEADLRKPGRYKWYCPVGDHEGRGMKGEITVTRAGSAGGPRRSGSRAGGSNRSGPSRDGTSAPPSGGGYD